MTSEARSSVAAWKRCCLCTDKIFKTPQEFRLHLRTNHCKKEGGSYVCCYGKNNICGSLPLEGVNDQDYEYHVVKHHVLTFTVDDDHSHGDKFMKNLHQKYAHIFTAGQSDVQPNVVAHQYKWTIYDSSQNLPAVLNDPRRIKREYDLFTKTWGDNFIDSASLPATHLPEISKMHFERYLKHIRKGLGRNVKQSLLSGSNSILSPLDKLSSKCAEIQDIPKIFLQSDFNLECPETFNAVIPWSQLYSHKEGTVQKNSVKLLQEKMSHYLDIAEVHIAKQISMRSEAFFHAMTSHDALMDQLTHIIKSVCDLRDRIHVIEDVLVSGPMKIMRLKLRQRNMVETYKKLYLMSTIHQTQATIQQLLHTSDFVGALDMIYITQDLLAKELSSVQSFRHLSPQLAEMEKAIGKMMEADFVVYITADLNRPHAENLIMEEERLIAIVFGMLQQNNFKFLTIFKEECFTTIKALMKQTVIEEVSKVDDLDVESNAGNLADQLTILSFGKWLELFGYIMKNLDFLLLRIQVLYHVMDNTLEVAAGHLSNISADGHPLHLIERDIMVSERDYAEIKPKLKDVLCSVCDHAHDCCAKIMEAKSKGGSLSKLPVEEFRALCESVDVFQAKCEKISGKPSSALRSALQTQAHMFATKFHNERKKNLSLILENEQWKQADVPIEFQELVDSIISTGCILSMKSKSPLVQHTPQAYLVVNNENFAVSGTALMLLKMVIDYCQCAQELPILAAELSKQLVDLLKVFNCRTFELVLKAGALKVVGLKTITTRHLALTSRCLHLILYFVPYVKNHFQSLIQGKQEKLDKHFDQVTKIYSEHISQISQKLETIICDMLEVQLKKWEVKAPVPSPSFNTISKQLNRVHELVHSVLPPEELKNIFSRVNNTFFKKLRYHLARLQVNNDGGPQHGLVTQELTFYIQNLKKLEVPCDFNLNDLWEPRIKYTTE